jgi:uncharacterized phosphosugar-binding protein
MTNLSLEYLDQAQALLARVREEEQEAMDRAAELLADAVVGGQRIFAFGCTHSALPVQDIVYRAGGLMLVNPIMGPGITSLETRPTTLTSAMEKLEGYADALLDASPIQPGDVLIVVSVSGRNAVPIEMARSAKERGLQVIALTSMAYSSSVDSRHPSGAKVYELADVVLDNKADVGDAVLEHDGVPQRFSPASGVTSTAILHAVVSGAIEKVVAAGVEPPVFLAANVDGGAEYNARLTAEHRDRIFFL